MESLFDIAFKYFFIGLGSITGLSGFYFCIWRFILKPHFEGQRIQKENLEKEIEVKDNKIYELERLLKKTLRFDSRY